MIAVLMEAETERKKKKSTVPRTSGRKRCEIVAMCDGCDDEGKGVIRRITCLASEVLCLPSCAMVKQSNFGLEL